jgi:hypothetical protein
VGVSGQGHLWSFASVAGANLLDSGAADAGPWTDGIGYGTFEATSGGNPLAFNLLCVDHTEVWESLAYSVSPA